MLLADVPGHDCYDATRPELEAMVDTLVDLQGAWAGRVDDVLALGAPDWRSSAFIHLAQDVVERDAGAELRTVLDPFVERLPQAFADLDSCGPPEHVRSRRLSSRQRQVDERRTGRPRLGRRRGWPPAARPARLPRPRRAPHRRARGPVARPMGRRLSRQRSAACGRRSSRRSPRCDRRSSTGGSSTASRRRNACTTAATCPSGCKRRSHSSRSQRRGGLSRTTRGRGPAP